MVCFLFFVPTVAVYSSEPLLECLNKCAIDNCDAHSDVFSYFNPCGKER